MSTPYPKTIRGRLLRKWDWLVYRLAYRSVKRICEDNPGIAYLIELWIRDWNGRADISPALKAATETFHAALKEARK